MEVYGNEYVMYYLYYEWFVVCDKKFLLVYDCIIVVGGQMGVYNGWECVNWYVKDGDDILLEVIYIWGWFGLWEQCVKEECEVVCDGCGVFDLSGFFCFMVKGEGIVEVFCGFVIGGLLKVGCMNFVYIFDDRGCILMEMFCICMGEDDFLMIIVVIVQWYDCDILCVVMFVIISIEDVIIMCDMLIVIGLILCDVFVGFSDVDLLMGWLIY